MNKCIDCKYCDEEGLCTSNGDEECFGDVYKQGREDMINAIKNDLHDRLTEEMNNPYQDQGLCQGLYYAMQRCDWFLSDD